MKQDAKLRAADTRLRNKYNILTEKKGGPGGFAGVDEYNRRLREQNGVCALCHRPPKPGRRLAQDHNHSSGRLRGLLDTVCNARVLGRLERHKNRVVLKDLVEYLKKFDPENTLLKGIN